MAFATLYRVVQDLEGNAVTGVLGTVLYAGTSTLATLFADAEGTVPLPNPTTNNAQYGSFMLYLASGVYDLQCVKSGFVFETQRDITLIDPDAGVHTITGTANRILVSPPGGTGSVTLSTPQDLAPDSSLQFAHLGLGTPATGSALTVNGVSNFTGQLFANQAIISGGQALGLELVSITGVPQRVNLSCNGIIVNDYTPSTADPLGLSSNISAGANRFNLYIDGAADNYLRGALGIGGIPAASTKLTLLYDKNAIHGLRIRHLVNDTGSGAPAIFENVAGTGIGSITSTASAVSFNTSSDVRLKHDIANLTGELALIQALRPVSFRWNVDDSLGHGFLAHEVAALVAGVISGEADAVDKEGRILPQLIDYSKLVPWLVGAIQTLAQRLEVVEDAVGA